MSPMTNLFTELPDLFAIVEELQHYSNQIAIPVNTISSEFDLSLPTNPTYPIITLTNAAINMILSAFPSISQSFMIMMMKKHRLVDIKIPNLLALLTPLQALLLYHRKPVLHQQIKNVSQNPQTWTNPHHNVRHGISCNHTRLRVPPYRYVESTQKPEPSKSFLQNLNSD